ncbi:hypothetical protein HDU87_000745 [Geranomyces variabilis]|uniref:Swiss Army Knife RNA repair protein HAD domain-containing protein n=1 Tax=Geranomyces variabilis TaxID=109894 RepID=A0AAD5TQF1_9FUNG|nr:hypothetical protein HDU87_000745 [Geranomyces variabilis]
MTADRFYHEIAIKELAQAISQPSTNNTPPRKITALHVFDFDSTLFRSPLPNRAIWSDTLRGALISDCGWFQDSRTLESPYVPTAPGPEWWHAETVAEIARSRAAASTTLRVLLTGRRRDRFYARVREMCRSYRDRDRDPDRVGGSNGIDFDAWFLREGCSGGDAATGSVTTTTTTTTTAMGEPRTYATTLDFKLDVLRGLVAAFPGIVDIQIWDDRVRHLELFSEKLRAMQGASQIERFEVHHVAHLERDEMVMPEELEDALVRDLVAACNARIIAAKEREAMCLHTGTESSTTSLPEAGAVNGNKTHNHHQHRRRVLARRTSASLFRDLLELTPEVRYTGVMLDKDSRTRLLAAFPPPEATWATKCDHVTINLGAAKPALVDPLGGLGTVITLDAVALGETPGVVTAVLVSHPQSASQSVPNPPPPAPPPPPPSLSENTNPHITLHVAPGHKPHLSNAITDWRPLPTAITLRGTIAEKHVFGLRVEKHPPQRRQEVSIGELVKRHHPALVGADVGKAVRAVHEWMEKTFMENLGQNRANIECFVQGMDFGNG